MLMKIFPHGTGEGDKLSLSGLFQRVDNFLGKGLDESIEKQRERTRQERAERETVTAALGKAFPLQEELALTRENHNAVMRELQRMQDDPNYVSTWTPKTSLTDEQPKTAEAAQLITWRKPWSMWRHTGSSRLRRSKQPFRRLHPPAAYPAL